MSIQFYIHLINRCLSLCFNLENDYIISSDGFYLLEEQEVASVPLYILAGRMNSETMNGRITRILYYYYYSVENTINIKFKNRLIL